METCASLSLEEPSSEPAPIEIAFSRNFSRQSDLRWREAKHAAHLDLLNRLDAHVERLDGTDICSAEFLTWLHERFYRRALKYMGPDPDGHCGGLSPGRLSASHPEARALLCDFSEFYGPLVRAAPRGLVAAAAAHHRLMWIRPFAHGNGVVARLFTRAWFIKAGIAEESLWSLARGLSRCAEEYAAKFKAVGGREAAGGAPGAVSRRALRDFCEFFLRTALAEAGRMREILSPEGIDARITKFSAAEVAEGRLPAGAGLVLRETFRRGDLARGEVASIIDASPRTARKLVAALVERGFLGSASPRGALRLAFPVEIVANCFPGL